MPANLHGRSFLKLLDFAPADIHMLLTLSRELKAAKHAGTERPRLLGKNIALIFEKDSTRTRAGFEVAAHDQGAHVTYLGPSGSHIGHKESIADTARVLGRMFDAIEYRGFSQENVEVLARLSGVPVFNGLTDDFHPTQVLADLMTMREHSPKHFLDMSLWQHGGVPHGGGGVDGHRHSPLRPARLVAQCGAAGAMRSLGQPHRCEDHRD